MSKCPRCEGCGELQVWDAQTPDGEGRIEVCPECDGTGEVPVMDQECIRLTCPLCRGEGVVTQEEAENA